MSGIHGKDTKPELLVRRGLHARGYRYRLHASDLPGRPDLVMPKYRAVIFVHGCFWHGHGCHMFKWPSTRPEFWRAKINGNIARDKKHRTACCEQGWRVLTIWECALRGRESLGVDVVLNKIERWLNGSSPAGTIVGNSTGTTLRERNQVREPCP